MVCYLRLIQDEKLLWGENIRNKVAKATNLLWAYGRAVRAEWVLKPAMVGLLHLAMVRLSPALELKLLFGGLLSIRTGQRRYLKRHANGRDRVLSHYPQHSGVRGCAQPASSIYVQGEAGAAPVRLKAQRN